MIKTNVPEWKKDQANRLLVDYQRAVEKLNRNELAEALALALNIRRNNASQLTIPMPDFLGFRDQLLQAILSTLSYTPNEYDSYIADDIVEQERL